MLNEDVKLLSIFKDSLEGDAEKLLAFLSKSPIRKLITSVVGNKKKSLTISKALRVRYAYCAYRLLVEEFGNEFSVRWFLRPNLFLGYKTPAFALRYYNVKKLTLLVNAAMACIQVSHGILP